MSDSSDEDAINYGDDIVSDDSDNEVLASEDEDDDDDEIDDDRFNRFKIELKKDEMASDLEDNDDSDLENCTLPSSQAWGKNKKTYYHTDYIDKDFRGQKQKDEDLAQYEEEEALQIQKRLLNAVNEQDLDIDLLIDKNPQKSALTKEKKPTKMPILLGILSDSQKISMIKQESPELELLKSDFTKYSSEIQNELIPLVNNFIENKAIHSDGLKYLKLKLLILLNYCTNISFYFSMKCSKDRQIVKEHPIIKRLFIYKKLISELETIRSKNPSFLNEIEFILKSINNGRKLEFLESSTIDDNLMELDDSGNDGKTADKELDDEEIDDNEDTIEDDEKRAITYEMKKNKGLTPKRKREQRNPRVKYRKKFEKAIVRRKGQVREPRKELKKYGGELTGINVRAVKSVKFK